MIILYNRIQIFKAGLCFLAAAGFYTMASVFVHMVLKTAFTGLQWSFAPIPWLILAFIGTITWIGWQQWRAGPGYKSFKDFSFNDLGSESAGASVVDQYTHKVTGLGPFFNQVFLGGPLLTIRAVNYLRHLVQDVPGLEPRLQEALRVLRETNEWQAITEHPAIQDEILMLARMNKIEHNLDSGTLRIKASPHDGIQL